MHAVGPHVGDETNRIAIQIDTLKQALRHLHRAIGGKAELAGGFLLQGGGRERRRRVAADLLLFNVRDTQIRGIDAVAGGMGLRLIGQIEFAEFFAIEHRQAGLVRLPGWIGELRLDRPIFLRGEGLDLRLAFRDEPQRHRLHTAGRARALQLAPQNGREIEADQIIQSPAGLVGVDQMLIEIPRAIDRAQDGLFGDLVEDDAFHIDILDRLFIGQRLQQVPRDGLALAVRVGGKIKPVGGFDRLGDLVDPLLFVRQVLIDHVKIIVRDHRAILFRKIADVTVGRQNCVIRAEIFIDCFGFGRRFNDDDIHGQRCSTRKFVAFAGQLGQPPQSAYELILYRSKST